MAKNNSVPQPQQPPAELKTQPRPEAAPPEAEASRAQIWTFALALALVLITARALDFLLPGIPESHIERWLMLCFGIFLAAFLAWLK